MVVRALVHGVSLINFDMNKVVNESNRFGWMVEYKPTGSYNLKNEQPWAFLS